MRVSAGAHGSVKSSTEYASFNPSLAFMVCITLLNGMPVSPEGLLVGLDAGRLDQLRPFRDFRSNESIEIIGSGTDNLGALRQQAGFRVRRRHRRHDPGVKGVDD